MNQIISAFFDGFTGGSLLSRSDLPGSATQVFADEYSTHPQEELVTALLQSQHNDAMTEQI